MKKRTIFLLLLINICIFGAFLCSKCDLLDSYKRLTAKQHVNGVLQAPARRSLLSDSSQGPDTALVAALDGTIYLMERGSMNPLWSFSSGPSIYSSYQAPVNVSENVSGKESGYFIDCGDDWELYMHTGLTKVKLMWSLEEYISSTPHITDNGGIVLGSKKTTAFLVDMKTGKIIYAYPISDHPTMMQKNGNDFPHNTTVEEQVLSGSDLKTDDLPMYITRTDYTLTSFIPNSDKVLWNMTVAEIGAAFLCEKSSPDSVSLEPSLPFNMPLSCQSRARVYRFRSENILELFSRPKELPDAHHLDVIRPALPSNILPSQPNVEKVIELLPSFQNRDKSLDSRHNKALEDVHGLITLNENHGVSHMQDVKIPSNSNTDLVDSRFSTCLVLFVLLFVGYLVFRGKLQIYHRVYILRVIHMAIVNCIKAILGVELTAQQTGTTASNTPSKRKKPRRSSKAGNSNEKRGKEENDATYESGDNFWLKLNRPISNSKDGRYVGKLFVSNKEIAKGSNGTIVLEGVYEGRAVAVKRLVRTHHDIASKEIQNLVVSDCHPNIVRWYGVEQDQDFVYLALERGACSLHDLIHKYSESSENPTFGMNMASEIESEYKVRLDSMEDLMKDCELWNSDGGPSPMLLKLMRDVISGLVHLHELGIVHRDLKPQNVLIIKERTFVAKLSDMGISKQLAMNMSSLGHHATGYGSAGWQAPEQLLNGRQTRAVDVFSLGCVLFFCITGGRHPFGNHLERDVNISKNKVDLFLVEHIPEAVDLFLRLLNPDPELRPKAAEVLNHPFFWDAEMRLDFFRDVSDKIEDEKTSSELLNALESIAPAAIGGKWDEKMEPSVLNDIGRFRRYKFETVRDLLRVMRNKLNHYRELPPEIQEIFGPLPEGFDRYFKNRFPKLLIEVYKVVQRYCSEENGFRKYFKDSVL